MEDIAYYSEDAWQKYFNADLAEFYSCVVGFLNLRDEVIQQISDQTIGELIKNSELWKNVFLGGFTADESKPYYENALAKFYDEVFGIGVSNIGPVISRLKEGLTLESATEDIKPTIKEETPIIKRLSELRAKLEAIFSRFLRDIVDKPSAKEYKIENSFFGLNALRDVLNAGKKLLPLYNPLSFFIMSVYSIPKFYVQEAYPKLFEEDTKKVLEKRDIRIVKLLEPDLPDEKIRTERAIVGLDENSVGWLLGDIILDIYSLFQIESLAKFFNVEDEFAKFIKINIGKLRQSIVIDHFSDLLRDLSGLRSYNSTKALDNRVKVPDQYDFCYHNWSKIVSGSVE